jgi:hypothetical protein
MIMDGKVLKQAFAFAGALGRFQGLIEYVRRNPDYYSREELVAEVCLSWIVRNELSSMH